MRIMFSFIGFKTLSLNDQVKLIQTSIYPIELLNMSKVFDPVTKQYNYFTYTKEEENIMMQHFPMLRVFQVGFVSCLLLECCYLSISTVTHPQNKCVLGYTGISFYHITTLVSHVI